MNNDKNMVKFSGEMKITADFDINDVINSLILDSKVHDPDILRAENFDVLSLTVANSLLTLKQLYSTCVMKGKKFITLSAIYDVRDQSYKFDFSEALDKMQRCYCDCVSCLALPANIDLHSKMNLLCESDLNTDFNAFIAYFDELKNASDYDKIHYSLLVLSKIYNKFVKTYDELNDKNADNFHFSK